MTVLLTGVDAGVLGRVGVGEIATGVATIGVGVTGTETVVAGAGVGVEARAATELVTVLVCPVEVGTDDSVDTVSTTLMSMQAFGP